RRPAPYSPVSPPGSCAGGRPSSSSGARRARQAGAAPARAGCRSRDPPARDPPVRTGPPGPVGVRTDMLPLARTDDRIMIEQRPSRRRPLRERLELEPRALRRRADLRALPFETTEEVEPFGYNLFVSGQPGSGRESTVRDYLTRFSAGRPRADDWVYVHSFDEPDRPRAIRLPAG